MDEYNYVIEQKNKLVIRNLHIHTRLNFETKVAV